MHGDITYYFTELDSGTKKSLTVRLSQVWVRKQARRGSRRCITSRGRVTRRRRPSDHHPPLRMTTGFLHRHDAAFIMLSMRLASPASCFRCRVIARLVEFHYFARHDLPRQAELVRKPAALHFFAAIGGELVPQRVDLFLGLAEHHDAKSPA